MKGTNNGVGCYESGGSIWRLMTSIYDDFASDCAALGRVDKSVDAGIVN